MKKTVILLASGLIMLCSCGGGGLKADVNKTAKLECEIEQLEKKVSGGEAGAQEKLDKAKKDLEELEKKMMEKYKDKIMDKDFAEKAAKYAEEAKKDCK